MIKQLKQYCEEKLLQFEIQDDLFIFNDKEYQIVDQDALLFDSDFDFLPKSSYDVDGFIYQFGGHFYIQEGEEVSLDRLIYKGKAVQKIPMQSFISIHSGNELLNGVSLYGDWIKKAKFLGIKNLGICEKKTLAGVIDFQNQCKKNDINSIIGMTIPVKGKGEDPYDLKAYVKDFQGWQNLLKFNSLLNVEEQLFVLEEIVEKYQEGLIFILDPKTIDFKNIPPFIKYYNVDTVKFEDEEKDLSFFNNLGEFLQSDLLPVCAYDAYYLEQEDWIVRERLWGIAKSFDFKTKNQHFKNYDEFARELILLFEKDNKSWIKLFKSSIENLNTIVSECQFEYDTTSRHLPAYIMTREEQENFDSNEELFMHLIKKGFKDRKIVHAEKYIERLKEEIHVLKTGDVIDYFLTLHDIVRYARSQDILVGIGRGSAGGSLVSYLLGIIQIDPIEFNLLFARFLNVGRMGEFKECKAYEIETESGTITLNEKSLLRVKREDKELPIFIEDLQQGDEILKY